MGNRRLAACLLYPACLLAVGCQAFYSYRPVPVLVRDAETGKPITGAEVKITYPLTRPSQAPWDSVAATSNDGIARLRAAPYGDGGIMVAATAQGYMGEQKNPSVDFVQQLEPPHLFEAVEQRPSCYVVDLYAEPRPSIELVLPTAYRGIVKVLVHVDEAVPLASAQRFFRFEVPSSGVVEVKGPSLLRRVNTPEYAAKYADGHMLKRNPEDFAEIGFRWVKCEGADQIFHVGTQTEFDDIRRSYEHESDAGSHSTSGGKGDGRGKRGRRASQDSSQ